MDKSAWLSQVSEDIVDPDRKICDPHHHLWDHPGSRYLLDELLSDLNSGHKVSSTVFVECSSMFNNDASEAMAPVGETEFVQGIAAMSASGQYGPTRVASAIVSFADLTLASNVRPILEAHQQASRNRFRGIRHATGWHQDSRIKNSHSQPSESLMLDDAFQQGLSVLSDMGLTFDAWFYHHQLPEFVALAKSFPRLTIILDHFGGPLGIGPYNTNDTYQQWAESISELKDCENVHFKLGGINMKVNGYDWHKREMPPGSDELNDRVGRYYETCIDLFGADRCMFESNFPVDKESCSYQVLWNSFKKLTANRSEQEKNALFHDTAARVYQINIDKPET